MDADYMLPLVLTLDVHSLTMSLINIASSPGHEDTLADAVATVLRPLPHLAVERVGSGVIARTDAGHAERVVVAAHLTAPSDEQPLAYVELGSIFGPGASGGKGALAVALKAAATDAYGRDVTFVFAAGGPCGDGLGAVADDLLRADFALLTGPTNCTVRGGAADHRLVQRLTAITASEPGPLPGGVGGHGLARLAALGVPAAVFGPGDPSVAGTAGDFVTTVQLGQAEFALRRWLAE